jgi:hypothetical protein
VREDWWNDAQLTADRTDEQIYDDIFEEGYNAAKAGKPAMEFTHEAWMHGWGIAQEELGNPDFVMEPEIDASEQETVDLAEREIGFQAGLDGEELDPAKSSAWQRGWADAQE